jgi:hypothetical protein
VTRPPVFDPVLFAREAVTAGELDLRVDGREVVTAIGGVRVLRVRFSFASYRGFLEDEVVRRSTGVVNFPVGPSGHARVARSGPVLLSEFPPGSSRSGFSVHTQYGERPATELGLIGAVVDVRGPFIRELREFANPDDPTSTTFRDEEQFGYAMLRSFQETGDLRLLWEYRVAETWLRAIQAVDDLAAEEIGRRLNRFLLVGEGYGALGAAQAAAVDDRVDGLVFCGWPLDWTDLHFTRWRRWEREARYQPLGAIQPSPYRDSREVMSFLFSTFSNPDPGCPSCAGAGDVWRSQFNYLDLVRDERLRGVRTLVLVGDSDPRFPIDLEARASVAPEAVAALPAYPGGPAPPEEYARGPFARRLERFPFHDLRYLERSASTISNREAIEATIAWVQHVSGHRDVPRVRISESIEDGNVRLDIVVREGNAAPHGVEVHLTEIEGAHDFDFKHSLHRSRAEPMVWRRFDAIYAGHDAAFRGRWKALFPVSPSRNRAYYVVVRDQAGGLESAHSLPIRPLWNLGDPAFGPAR